MTLKEVAAYTGLSKSYLWKLTASGKIKHSKPTGKVIFFDKAVIDEFFLGNRPVNNGMAKAINN